MNRFESVFTSLKSIKLFQQTQNLILRKVL